MVNGSKGGAGMRVTRNGAGRKGLFRSVTLSTMVRIFASVAFTNVSMLMHCSGLLLEKTAITGVALKSTPKKKRKKKCIRKDHDR